MSFETIWENNGVYQRFRGQLTKQDKENANHEVMGSQRFEEIKYWIVDSLEIESYMPNQTDAMVSAAHDLGAEHYNSDLLMAFVANNIDHIDNIKHYMGILEQYSAWKVRLFDDIESARKWISKSLGS